MSWLSSFLLVQSIDNIDNNHRFMRIILKFFATLEISWIATFSMLEEGAKFLARLTAGKGGCSRRKGDRGTGLQWGSMLWRIFEPAWETGDDQAKLEGSQGCSNLIPA